MSRKLYVYQGKLHPSTPSRSSASYSPHSQYSHHAPSTHSHSHSASLFPRETHEKPPGRHKSKGSSPSILRGVFGSIGRRFSHGSRKSEKTHHSNNQTPVQNTKATPPGFDIRMLNMNPKHMDLTDWEYSEEEANFEDMEWFKVCVTTPPNSYEETLFNNVFVGSAPKKRGLQR